MWLVSFLLYFNRSLTVYPLTDLELSIRTKLICNSDVLASASGVLAFKACTTTARCSCLYEHFPHVHTCVCLDALG